MTSPRIEHIGEATLYLGDCRDGMQAIPRDAAIVADPPYGMSYDTDSRRFSGFKSDGLPPRGDGRADREIAGDNEEFDPVPWLAFDEVILWGSNHYAQKLPLGTTLVWLKKYPEHYGTFLSDAEMAWQKGNHGIYVFNAPDSMGRRRLEYTGSIMGAETAHVSQKPIRPSKRRCSEEFGEAGESNRWHIPFSGSANLRSYVLPSPILRSPWLVFRWPASPNSSVHLGRSSEGPVHPEPYRRVPRLRSFCSFR